MSSQCEAFLPNIWRPRLCQLCQRPKEYHDVRHAETETAPSDVLLAQESNLLDIATGNTSLDPTLSESIDPIAASSNVLSPSQHAEWPTHRPTVQNVDVRVPSLEQFTLELGQRIDRMLKDVSMKKEEKISVKSEHSNAVRISRILAGMHI